MKIDWRAFSHIGAAMLGTVIPGVAAVEQLAWSLGTKTGEQKAESVVEMGAQTAIALSAIAGKALAEDADVRRAIRAVVDAVVTFHKIIAKKAAAAGVTP